MTELTDGFTNKGLAHLSPRYLRPYLSSRNVIYVKAMLADGKYYLKEVYNNSFILRIDFVWNIESYYPLRRCIPIDYSEVSEDEIRTYLALEGIYEEV